MKKFLKSALLALPALAAMNLFGAGEHFTPPASPRMTFNFNAAWKFIREDVTNAEAPAFDDSKWADVSTPHTYNDTDTYDEFITHGGGERHQYMGIAWYRKHFVLPPEARGNKVFLELDGLKQAGRFFVNGKFVGKYENGVTACGLDLTEFVTYDGSTNILAVKVDNSNDYAEEATGSGYQWMGKAFNPNYGGLNHDIWLHITSKIYATFPLYENLQTKGAYIHASDFNIAGRTCSVAADSQVRNESGDNQSLAMTYSIVDSAGNECATFQSDVSDLVDGQSEVFTGSGKLANAQFWDVEKPAFYDVYCVLKASGKVVDVQKVRTGFRKVEFKGGAGTGGVWLNDHFVYLKGYAQRSSDDWAGLGQAYPDWMHQYNADIIRSTHGNYIRWMHISPQRVDVEACERAGIIQACPAGDKEGDAKGRQWDQRVEVMRDSMIYYRNHPGIIMWEAGNSGVSADHFKQMLDLKKELDPDGGRALGCRTLTDPATTHMAEYFGVMVGQDPRTDAVTEPGQMFRAYSVERRDLAPLIETEDFRDEAARRFWDDYSPPHFGFKKGPDDSYGWNSESFCLAAASRYYAYLINCITNTDKLHSKWSGYASIYWSDSNADGRQQSSEVCRVSGKVDSLRLPKQAYYAYRVMQSDAPDIHIIGHWSYPSNTVKAVYVFASHCDSVELLVNGTSLGKNASPRNGFVFEFPGVKFEPGKITAVARASGVEVARDEIETSGEPHALKLTPHVGPDGLLANGADVAFFDVECVDSKGRRCPTDEARVDFKVEGPAIWRGGLNSGKPGSVNNLWLDTECGVNRVSIRSTLNHGTITLTATRKGLEPATVSVQSLPVKIVGGLVSMNP